MKRLGLFLLAAPAMFYLVNCGDRLLEFPKDDGGSFPALAGTWNVVLSWSNSVTVEAQWRFFEDHAVQLGTETMGTWHANGNDITVWCEAESLRYTGRFEAGAETFTMTGSMSAPGRSGTWQARKTRPA